MASLLIAAVSVIMASGVSALGYWSTTCGRQTTPIICSQHDYIYIHYAFYGRENYWTCPGSKTHKSGCRSHISLREVRVACQGYHYCAIDGRTRSRVFGDPCRGISKYLKINWSCLPSPHNIEMTRRACAKGSTLRLSCPTGFQIDITKANYGRTSYYPCPQKNRRHLNCRAADSYSIVRSACDGRRSCAVRASSSVFGDPCRGTDKYLEVSYRCLH